MIVKVDETGGNDETARVDRVPAAYGLRCDDGDSSIEEPDIVNRIEFGARVHNVAAENRAIVDGVRRGQPTCARNRRQTGLDSAIRSRVGVNRPLS